MGEGPAGWSCLTLGHLRGLREAGAPWGDGEGLCIASRHRARVVLRGEEPTPPARLTFLPLPTEDRRLGKGGTGCTSEEGSPFLKGHLPRDSGGGTEREVGRRAGDGFWIVGSSQVWASICLTLGY